MPDCTLSLGQKDPLKPGSKPDDITKESPPWQKPPVNNIIRKGYTSGLNLISSASNNDIGNVCPSWAIGGTGHAQGALIKSVGILFSII